MSYANRNRAWLPRKIGTRLTLLGMSITLAVCAVICAGAEDYLQSVLKP